jgi:hypothetical protein
MAQVRMLGGSIGIAASTAILGVKQRQQLFDTGVVTPLQLNSLRNSMHELSSQQVHTVQQAYTDAFNETMAVCAILSGICILVTVGCWQKNPMTMEDRRKKQGQNEAMRQHALGEAKARAAAIKATDAQGEMKL